MYIRLCDNEGNIGEAEFQNIMRLQIRMYTQVDLVVVSEGARGIERESQQGQGELS